ncbi:unnamed protein product, partial [Meganyctiphanes norvegica]
SDDKHDSTKENYCYTPYDKRRAELDKELGKIGRSGRDVSPISFQGKGYESKSKNKKEKPASLEQKIKERLYPLKLIERLQKNSVEKDNIKEMLSEWKFYAYQYDDNDGINAVVSDTEHLVHEGDNNQCSCGKTNLKHLFFMKNEKHEENPILIVGSECITWFQDHNSSFLYEIFLGVFTKKHQYTFCGKVESEDMVEHEAKMKYEFRTSAHELCLLRSHQNSMLKTFRSIPFAVRRKYAYVSARPLNDEQLMLMKN